MPGPKNGPTSIENRVPGLSTCAAVEKLQHAAREYSDPAKILGSP